MAIITVFISLVGFVQGTYAQSTDEQPDTVYLPLVAGSGEVAIDEREQTPIPTSHGGSSGALCIRDAADFDQGQICTANDVRIGSYELLAGPSSCTEGERITVSLRAAIESGPERYDVGLWVDEGGGNALSLLVMSLLAPMAAMLIQMAISRSREYMADADGARFAGNPRWLANALEKLGAFAGKLPMNANPSTAHMFIVNPLSGRSLMNLFSTHPPLEERIARLRGMAASA